MGLIFFEIALLLVGFVLLTYGARYLVKGAIELAYLYHLPEILIGMSILALGTSLPELIVCIVAINRGFSDMVFSTLIGANIFNLYAILGLIGLIFPFYLSNTVIFKEIPLMILATLIIVVITNDQLLFDASENVISQTEGQILLFCFSLFVLMVFLNLRKGGFSRIKFEEDQSARKWQIFIWISGGAVATAFGGELIVDEATRLIQRFELTQRFFGITVIAFFTSLPELATSAIAVYKRKPGLAFGNILGSTMFNFLFVLGVSALINQLDFNKGFNFDLNFFLFGTILLFVGMFSGKMKKLDRWQSFFFLLFFVAYLYFVWVRI